MIILDEPVEDKKRTKTIDSILGMFDTVPCVSENKINYAVIGGFAVNVLCGDAREISDLDLVFNSLESPEVIYRRLRRKTDSVHGLKKVNIDVQSLARPIYQALLVNEEQFPSLIKNVDYRNRKISCMNSETIAACKIYSSFIQNDTLRDKDVRDIFLLQERQGFSLQTFYDIIENAPSAKNIKALDAIPFLMDKIFTLEKDDGELARYMLKHIRKISRLISSNASKVTAFYSFSNLLRQHIDMEKRSLEKIGNQSYMKAIDDSVSEYIHSRAGFIF